MSVFTIVGNSTSSNSGILLITIKVEEEKGLNDWCVEDVFINITKESTDIAEIRYRINGGAEQIYTGPFYLTEDGQDIMLEWHAIDQDGNYSEVDGPFICSIDQTIPEVDIAYEVLGWTPFKGWEFQFTATATDDMSGMDRVEFYFNNELQETVIGAGPEYVWTLFYYPLPGTAIFRATAYDKAGHSESDEPVNPCNIGLLKSAFKKPYIENRSIINIYKDDLSLSEVVKEERYNNTEKSPLKNIGEEVFDPGYVIVVFKKDTGKKGWLTNISIPIFYETDRVDKIYYQINNEDWMLYTDPLVFSDGFYYFSWYGVDSEGYTSSIDSIPFFKADVTAPEISLFSSQNSGNKIKFVAGVYDATSGIDRVEFYNIYPSVKPKFVDYDFPYEWIWTGSSNETVTAVVYDKAGNSNNSSMFISFNDNSNQQKTLKSTSLLIWKFLEKLPFQEVLLRKMNL